MINPFSLAIPPGISTGIPLGTIITYAGQVEYLNLKKNQAWPSCDSSTSNPCCAPQSSGTKPENSDSAPIIAIEKMGWMLCDGRPLLISKYNPLFNIIGYIYGGDEAQKYFNIPDCRGLFLRGVDAYAGMDKDSSSRQAADNSKGSRSSVGSLQCDALQSHQHEYNKIPGEGKPEGSFLKTGEGEPGVIASALTGEPVDALSPSPNSVRTSTETRPTNMAINFLIKCQ